MRTTSFKIRIRVVEFIPYEDKLERLRLRTENQK